MAKKPKHRKPTRPDGKRMSCSTVKRDPDGRPLCRWCDQPVPPPKLTFCGPDCIHEWKLRSQPSYLRVYVEDRDHGICALCGIDTFELQRHLRALYRDVRDDKGRPWFRSKTFWPITFGIVVKEALRFRLSVAQLFRLLERRHPYDVDHTVPLIEGGGHGLTNVRSLCIGCHSEETKKLAGRRTKVK